MHLGDGNHLDTLMFLCIILFLQILLYASYRIYNESLISDLRQFISHKYNHLRAKKPRISNLLMKENKTRSKGGIFLGITPIGLLGQIDPYRNELPHDTNWQLVDTSWLKEVEEIFEQDKSGFDVNIPILAESRLAAPRKSISFSGPTFLESGRSTVTATNVAIPSCKNSGRSSVREDQILKNGGYKKLPSYENFAFIGSKNLRPDRVLEL